MKTRTIHTLFTLLFTFTLILQPNMRSYAATNEPTATYTISGQIVDSFGFGVHDMSVVLNYGYDSVGTDTTGSYSFTAVPAGTYTVRANLPGYSVSPSEITVTVPSDAYNVNFIATPQNNSSIPFQPNPDGYNFPNTAGSFSDYSTPGMMDMFGSSDVCLFTYPGGCLINLSAEIWLLSLPYTILGGECEGMSLTSLRFFKGLDKTYDFGAQNTYGLNKDLKVGRNIGFYQVLQSARPVAAAIDKAWSEQSPNQVLSILLNNFALYYPDPYIGGYYPYIVQISGSYTTSDGVRHTGSHALVPFAIEKLSSNMWLIHVYDPNYPYHSATPQDSIRVLTISTDTNSWSYNLGGVLGTWYGQGKDRSISTLSTEVFNPNQDGQCPWCKVDTSSNQTYYTQSTTNIGNVVFTDNQGNQLGYVNGQLIDDIPGAFANPIITDGSDSALTYFVPITRTNTMSLTGESITQTQKASVLQFGPGYSFNLTQNINNATDDTITISPDGKNVSVTSNQPGKANLALTSEAISDTSYKFEINDISFDANQEVHLKNDTSNQKLVIKNHGVSNQTYSLSITRESAHGILSFAHPQLTVNPQDTDYLDYGSWSGAELILGIDHGSDGSIDEVVPLKNGYDLYLPLVNH